MGQSGDSECFSPTCKHLGLLLAGACIPELNRFAFYTNGTAPHYYGIICEFSTIVLILVLITCSSAGVPRLKEKETCIVDGTTSFNCPIPASGDIYKTSEIKEMIMSVFLAIGFMASAGLNLANCCLVCRPHMTIDDKRLLTQQNWAQVLVFIIDIIFLGLYAFWKTGKIPHPAKRHTGWIAVVGVLVADLPWFVVVWQIAQRRGYRLDIGVRREQQAAAGVAGDPNGAAIQGDGGARPTLLEDLQPVQGSAPPGQALSAIPEEPEPRSPAGLSVVASSSGTRS